MSGRYENQTAAAMPTTSTSRKLIRNATRFGTSTPITEVRIAATGNASAVCLVVTAASPKAIPRIGFPRLQQAMAAKANVRVGKSERNVTADKQRTGWNAIVMPTAAA